jgi:hypothetical protein
MREIHLIDTSVFCNIMQIPGMCPQHKEALTELQALVSRPGTTLLLPVTTIYETGNHIAQNGSGGQRRQAAQRFVTQVQAAFDGRAPWTPTPLQGPTEMGSWLALFPDYALRGVGLGDLSIIKTFEQQCELNPLSRVRIWSYDSDLGGYDRQPTSSLIS